MKGKTGVLVFNPGSGKGKGAVRAQDFAKRWKHETGTDLALRPTRSREDIRVAARETVSAGDVQIFMGGDGTLSESIQGLAEASNFMPLPRAVGLLAGGTGNSFLRDFGIKDYKESADALLHGVRESSVIKSDIALLKYKQSDTGRETTRIMFNIWGMGLISEITETAIKMRYLGKLNYTVATLRRLATHSPKPLRMTIDNKQEEVTCNFVTISNSRYTGGEMKIAPEVRINDGKLFMNRPKIATRMGMLKLFPMIFDGSHINHPDVESRFMTSFSLDDDTPIVMNVDGELEYGARPRLDIQPNFWNIYMPKERLHGDH